MFLNECDFKENLFFRVNNLLNTNFNKENKINRDLEWKLLNL